MATEEIVLDREDVILLIFEANERLLRRQAFSGVTRLEKLLFLLEQETDFEGIGEFFEFKPHNFGPFSKEVYSATEFLNSCGLIEIKEKAYPSLYAAADEEKLLSEISEGEDAMPDASQPPQATEKVFALTDDGRKVARIIRDSLWRRRAADVESLDAIVRKYGPISLRRLIRYVYRQYPSMTVNSIHPEANNCN